MKIFAIDPGNVYSAYCIIDDQYKLHEFTKTENKTVMTRLLEILDEIGEVVIERIASYGMPVGRDVFETCEWIGRFAQEAEKKTQVDYIYRKEEKLYICGSPNAKDANIRAGLIERFAQHDFKNGKGTKKDPDIFYGVSADCWSAIAVAVTFLDKRRETKCQEETQTI